MPSLLFVCGTYNDTKDRGVVGERCPHCGRVTTLRVTQHYQTSHLYFLPLGSGKLVATVLTCPECQGQINGSVETYRCVLPHEVSLNMSLGEVLEETNPQLSQAVNYRAQLKQSAREARDLAPDAPDPRVELAFVRLAEIGSPSPEVYRLQGRLSQWGALDAATQAQLLRDVDEAVKEHEKHEATVRFLGLMGQKFKPNVDGGWAVLTAVTVTLFSVAAVVMLFGQSFACVGTLGGLVMGGGCALVVHRILRRRAHRRFFQKVFLLEADYHGISSVRALALLQQPDWLVPASDAGTRAMIAALPSLLEIIDRAAPEAAFKEKQEHKAAEHSVRTDGVGLQSDVDGHFAVLSGACSPRVRQGRSRTAPVEAQGSHGIEAVFKEKQEHEAAQRFVRVVGAGFKSEVDGHVAFLVFLLTAALLITVASLLLRDGVLAIAIVASIVAAIIAAVAAHRRFRRYTQSRFFRRTFLPAAHYQKVTVARTVGILEQIGSSEKAAAPEVRAMATALPLLQEILKAASRDGDIAQAAAELAKCYPKKPLTPRSYKWVGFVVVVALVFLCVGGLSWTIANGIAKRRAQEEAQDKYVAPFVARLAEFTPKAPEPDLQAPYRRGKVIPINVARGNGLDAILLSFPETLRPNAPDDVGTIVWLKWGEQAFGKYSDGMLASVITCRATVIDKLKNIIIAERDFVGGPPPQQRKPLEPCTGSSPAGEIIDWLESMPAK